MSMHMLALPNCETAVSQFGDMIARDAHARARFPQPPDGGPVVRRSREMRMHVLALLNCEAVASQFRDRARCACTCSLC